MSQHGLKRFYHTWQGHSVWVDLWVNQHDVLSWREANMLTGVSELDIYVDYLKLRKNSATPKIIQPDVWVWTTSLYNATGYSTDWATECSGQVTWKAEARYRFRTHNGDGTTSAWQTKFSGNYVENC